MPEIEINGRRYAARSLANVVVIGGDVMIDGKLAEPVDESGLPDMAGRWVARGDTFPWRHKLGVEGGEWNAEAGRWYFARKPTFAPLDDVAFVPDPLPENWRVVPQAEPPALRTTLPHGEMPGKRGLVVGVFVERRDGRRERFAVLAPISPEDLEAWTVVDERHKAGQAAFAELKKMPARASIAEGNCQRLPDMSFGSAVEGALVWPFEPERIADGKGWWLIQRSDEDALWLVVNNGGPGDDWSRNHISTQGRGAYGYRLSRSWSREIRELLQTAGFPVAVGPSRLAFP